MKTPELETDEGPKEKPIKSRVLKDCESLLKAASREIYSKNAFRVTRLPIKASAREIAKHGQKLQMMQELGNAESGTAANAEEIREALQKLKDPESRLIDEFFWVWPHETVHAKEDLAIEALLRGETEAAVEAWKQQEASPKTAMVARHNLAVVFHMAALDLENQMVAGKPTVEQKNNAEQGWQEAFARWEKVVTDEELWDRVAQRIRELEDERLTTGFGKRMRGSLPEALDKINAEYALAYADSGNMTEAARHVKYMRQTNQGLDNVEKTAELVLAPARTRLNAQMTLAEERAKKDPKNAIPAAKDLLYHGGKILELFDLFLGKGHATRNELADDIARICNQLPVTYHNATGDDKGCIEVLRATLPLATSMELRQQIEKNLATLGGNLQGKRLKPIYDLLKQIQESPEKAKKRMERMRNEVYPLIRSHWEDLQKHKEHKKEITNSFANVLRGISLDAWNKDQDKPTAVAANNWALEYAWDGDLLARLNQDRQTLASLQPPPPKVVQQVASGWAALKAAFGGLIVLFMVIGGISSCFEKSKNSSSSYTPSYTPSTTYTPSSTESTPSTQPSYGNSRGNTYRVPNTMSWQLDNEKAAIEGERAQLEALSNEITLEKASLDYAERTLNEYSQYEVDNFNARVHRYNAKLQDYKIRLAAFNSSVDTYNTKLETYGRR